MSIKEWTSHSGAFLDAGNWSDGLVPQPGDTMLIHHGYAVVTDEIVNPYQIFLGAPLRLMDMPGLVLDNATAQVSIQWQPDPDGENPFGALIHRYEWIAASGVSNLTLTDGGTGGSTSTWITVDPGSTLVTNESLGDNALVSVNGFGNLENLSTALFDSSEYVGVDVIGKGAWNLAGGNTLEFMASVGSDQVVTARANSTIVLDHADEFHGSINTLSWVGELLLDGISAGAAAYSNGVLSLEASGHLPINIKFQAGTLDTPQAFDVYNTAAGAAVVQHGTIPPPGAGALLLAQPA